MLDNYYLNNLYFKQPLEFQGIQVLQIGRRYCKSGTIIAGHKHPDLFELTIVTDGEGIVSTNGIGTKVKKGDIYISFPYDIHMIEGDKNHLLKFDFFAFRATNSPFDQALNHIRQACQSEHIRLFSDQRINPLIENAILELNTRNPFSEEILSSIFNQIIIYVIRNFQNKESQTPTINKSNAEILCYNLMNYIDTHLYTMKSLSELSEVTDYSYGYLSALFKKTTSCSLVDYYRKKKLEAARLLLIEGKLSATQISELLNYSTVYAFSKAFKQEFGESPTHYAQGKEFAEF